MWFQPLNLRDNLLNYNTDKKSNFWLKTNTIFFPYEFDLSLFSLQYNHVISGFKNIITNFHEATQNAVQWYWICETSCKEITWFATKFCIRVWFCPGSRAKQNSYHWNPLIFPKFLGQHDLSWKFFIITMDTGVEISLFSVYCKFKGSRSQRNLVKPGKKTFFFMQLARCVNIW